MLDRRALSKVGVARHARSMLLMMLGVATSATVALAIVRAQDQFSLGNAARSLAPTVACAAVFLLVAISARSETQLTLESFRVRPRWLGGLLACGLLIASVATRLGSLGSFYGPALVGTLAGVMLTLFLTVVRADLSGVVGFFLTLPLVQFLEKDMAGGATFFQNPGHSQSGYEVLVQGEFGGYLVLSPSIVYVWLFAGFFLIKRWSISKNQVATRALDKSVIAFGGLYLASVLVSREKVVSLACFWQFLTCGLVFYLIARFSAHTPDATKVMCGAVLVYVALRCFTGYYLYLQTHAYQTASIWKANLEWQAAIGPFSIMAACMIPVVLSLAEVASSRRMETMLRASVPLFLLIVLSLKQRAALAALALTFPCVLLYRRGRWYLLVAVVLGTSVLLLPTDYLRSQIFDRLADWTSAESIVDSQAMRIDAWQGAARVVRDHPLLGIGPGMWDHYGPDYLNYYWTTSAGRVYISYVHGLVPYYGVASGMGAAVALVIIVGLAMAGGTAMLRATQDKTGRPLVLGLLWWFAISFAVGSIAGASFEYKGGFERAAMFWLPLGMIAALEPGLRGGGTARDS